MKINISLSSTTSKGSPFHKQRIWKLLPAPSEYNTINQGLGIFTVTIDNVIQKLHCDPPFKVNSGNIESTNLEKLRNQVFHSVVHEVSTTPETYRHDPLKYNLKRISTSNDAEYLKTIADINSALYLYEYICVAHVIKGIISIIIMSAKQSAPLLSILKGFTPKNIVVQKIPITRDIPESSLPLEDAQKEAKLVYPYSSMLKSINVKLATSANLECSLKQHVVENLSKATGHSADTVSNIIKGWADSSFSDSSVNLHIAVAEIFGVKHTEYLERILKSGLSSKVHSTSYDIVNAIYKHTQSLLKESGISKVFLYRGFTSTDIIKDVTSRDIVCDTNPLSSFSDSFLTAQEFAINKGYVFRWINTRDEKNKITTKKIVTPKLLAGWFPAEAIFSTPLTGIGCHRETEYVVVGGSYKLYEDPLFADCTVEVFPDANITDFQSEMLGRLTERKDEDALIEAVERIARGSNMRYSTVFEMIKFSLPMTYNRSEGWKLEANTNKSASTAKSPYAKKATSSSDSNRKNIDQDINNADWCKQYWDLPKFGSIEFMGYLKASGRTLEQFKLLPVYKHAINKGLIKEKHENLY